MILLWRRWTLQTLVIVTLMVPWANLLTLRLGTVKLCMSVRMVDTAVLGVRLKVVPSMPWQKTTRRPLLSVTCDNNRLVTGLFAVMLAPWRDMCAVSLRNEMHDRLVSRFGRTVLKLVATRIT